MAEGTILDEVEIDSLLNFIDQLQGNSNSVVSETTPIKENPSNCVRYGNNGHIQKDTPEYLDWRKRNNEAIQRCRRKKQLKKKLNDLRQENQTLKNEDRALLNEILILHTFMSSQNALPEGATQLLNELLKLCKIAELDDEEESTSSEHSDDNSQ